MKNKKEFTEVFVTPDYPVETLINGNITECIEHLREIKRTGAAGEQYCHNCLVDIKNKVPERYEYVKNKVFEPRINS